MDYLVLNIDSVFRDAEYLNTSVILDTNPTENYNNAFYDVSKGGSGFTVYYTSKCPNDTINAMKNQINNGKVTFTPYQSTN